MVTGRRHRSPNLRRRPVLPPPPSHLVMLAVTTGGDGPPAVTTGCTAGSDPPGPLPIFPSRRRFPPSQTVVISPPATASSAPPPGKYLYIPADQAPNHAEWTRPRPGLVRARRSRSRRRCSWRSSSVVPPHTPCIWCVASAYCRHWRRTRHVAQTALARAISPVAGPRAATGKKSSGSASWHAADRHQSRRSSGGAPRWLGS
jgi:hypothetical protein